MLSRLRSAFAKTRLKEVLSASRFRGLKRLSESASGTLVFSVVSWVDTVTPYGVSFARPFARRRFNTRRPAFVAIRALNPCVRARFSVLG